MQPPEGDLYLPNNKISPESPKSGEGVSYGSPQKALLIRAMVDSYSLDQDIKSKAGGHTTDYSDEGGVRKLNFIEVKPDELEKLFSDFLNNPKEALGAVRINLINIVKDESIPEEQRKERLKRYLEAFLELIPKIDQYVFPYDSESKVLKGVPKYIPDGLSDMGSDPEIDPKKRSREKIRVNKQESYKKAFDSLFNALWQLGKIDIDPSSDSAKIFLAKHVMASVFKDMPYDYAGEAILPRDRSIRADEFVQADAPTSVCRHIAMETQLRLQALGLESRLLKCLMDGVPHVANLLRVNGQWYLLDSTNPELDPRDPAAGKVYARPIELTDAPKQTWNLSRFTKDSEGNLIPKDVVYESRNDMFYRILDNKNNPSS